MLHGEEPPLPSCGNSVNMEQYQCEGRQKASLCPNKYCVITPARLPPCPKKLLCDIEIVSSNQRHTSTPLVTKRVTKEEQPIRGTPVAKTERKVSTIDIAFCTNVFEMYYLSFHCDLFIDIHRQSILGPFRTIWTHPEEYL